MWRSVVAGALLPMGVVGHASRGAVDPRPCTRFMAPDGTQFLLGQAYAAADLVVIGRVIVGPGQRLHVSRRLKGRATSDVVALAEPVCHGTACAGGFSVAPGRDMLFLLSRQPSGSYDSVTGDGNMSCPVVYRVDGGAVDFRSRQVPLADVTAYLRTPSLQVPMP